MSISDKNQQNIETNKLLIQSEKCVTNLLEQPRTTERNNMVETVQSSESENDYQNPIKFLRNLTSRKKHKVLGPSILAEETTFRDHVESGCSGADGSVKYIEEKEEGVIISRLRQVLLAFIAASGLLICGMSYGWPAVLPKYMDDESKSYEFPKASVNWLVSVAYLTSIPSNLLSGSLMELAGPHRLILFMLLPGSAFWVLLVYATSPTMMLVARAGIGVMQGIPAVVIQPFVAEICEPSIRGLISTFPELMASIGVFVAYIMAAYLPWGYATIGCAVPLIVSFGFNLFVPESPYWLVRQGRRNDAESSLTTLLGPWRKKKIQIILKEIETSVSNQNQRSVVDQIKLFQFGQNWKPVVLMVVLFLLKEFGGQIAMFSYVVYVFKSSAIKLDAFTCTVLVGIVRFLSTCVGGILTETVGRRRLLLTTLIICGTSQTCAGINLIYNTNEDGTSNASWISLIAFLSYVASHGIGVGPCPWVIMGEIIPSPIRSIGCSIVTVSFTCTIFTLATVFPLLLDTIGLGNALFLFTASNFLGAIVVWIWIPETKGRSLLDLQDIFGKQEIQNSVCSTISNDNKTPFLGQEEHNAECDIKKNNSFI